MLGPSSMGPILLSMGLGIVISCIALRPKVCKLMQLLTIFDVSLGLGWLPLFSGLVPLRYPTGPLQSVDCQAQGGPAVSRAR